MKKLIPLLLFSFITFIATAQSDTSKTTAKEDSKDQVYTIVEKMPVYPGGDAAMVEFIQKNIKYPKKKKVEGSSVTCYVTFVVDQDGTLTNIRVLKGVKDGPQFDEAALDVVKKMPKWEPGTQNEKKVRVQYNLPIKFKL